MMHKKALLTVMLVFLCLGLNGCGSTAGTNTTLYFTQLSDRLSNWGNRAESEESQSQEEEDDTNRLSIPDNFQIDEGGNFTFTEVDGADHYLIFVYDALEPDGEYLFLSSAIPATEEEVHTGALNEYFSFSYGDYLLELVAYPSLTEKEYEESRAAQYEYLIAGEVEEPQYAYLWDYFSGTLSVELTNVKNYEFTAYPEQITFTLTNTEDSSDNVVFTLSGISLDDVVFGASVMDITTDVTYNLVAEAEWRNDIVYNAESTIDIGEIRISSTDNVMSEGYLYQDNTIYYGFDYPMVAENFNLLDGGSAGVWYYVKMPSDLYDPVTTYGSVKKLTFGDEDVYFTATPIQSSGGAEFSYSVVAQKEEGIIETSWAGETEQMTGTLNLYEDGTMQMELDYLLVGVNSISKANMELAGSCIQGTWTDNGDGTATLSYDHSTTVKYDTE